MNINFNHSSTENFANKITAAALQIRVAIINPIFDNRWHRAAAFDKNKRNSDASYIINPCGCATIRNFYTGAQITVWDNSATKYKKSELLQQIKQQEENQRLIYEQVALKANNIWYEASEIINHQYLEFKGIPAYGTRLNKDGRLIIPLQDISGKLWNIQFIDRKGNKLFLKGGKKKGNFYLIGDLLTSDTVLISEGFATGASLYRATGLPVVVAFDAYNLQPVILNLQNFMPDKTFINCADDDSDPEKQINTGRTIAEKLLKEFGVKSIFPNFKGC